MCLAQEKSGGDGLVVVGDRWSLGMGEKVCEQNLGDMVKVCSHAFVNNSL